MSDAPLRRRLRQPFEYLLLRALMGLVRRAPWRVGRAVAWLLGTLLYALPPCRRLVDANLQLAFPDWPDSRRRRVGREALRHMIRVYSDVIWLQARPAELERRVDVAPADLQLLHDCREAGTGALVLTPHLGNWEIGNLATNLHGVHTRAVARQLDNPRIERYLGRLRTSFGARVIHQRGALRSILRALREGALVALLVDQNTRPYRGGMFIDFFGVPATMSRLPCTLVRRHGVPLILGECIAMPDGRYRLAFCRIEVPPEPDDNQVAAAIIEATEDAIRQHPEQYLWFYKRWREIPPDLGDPPPAFPYYAKPYRDYHAEHLARQ